MIVCAACDAVSCSWRGRCGALGRRPRLCGRARPISASVAGARAQGKGRWRTPCWSRVGARLGERLLQPWPELHLVFGVSDATNVYHRCMSRTRTNIEIEDTYVQTIMGRYGVRTKTEAVEMALRHLAGQPMTLDEAIAMRGARVLGETPADSTPAGTV